MKYQARVDLLDDVLTYVETGLEEQGVSMKITMAFLVAVEEIFVNVAHYAYPGTEGDVDIDFSAKDGVARITFTDSGIAFDPLAKEDPDIGLNAEERNIGGLGIFMVKKSMDGVTYNRVDDKNVLSFWKNY